MQRVLVETDLYPISDGTTIHASLMVLWELAVQGVYRQLASLDFRSVGARTRYIS
jgi:hypothetical protein